MSESNATKWIGMAVERLEDPPLVAGRGRFAADINFARQLHMRMVRSNHAHGRIVAIDASDARAVAGVVAVWTAQDIADIGPIDFREGPIEKLAPYRQPVLAKDKVRYVGEPVAAVFAEDPYVAEDAADLVGVEIEELPPLMSARAEPGEFSPGRDTEADVLHQGYGDVDAVFATAHTIVELELTSGRHSGVPLETRGAIGRYDASRDVLELHGAAKVPHRNKELIARMLGRPPSSVQCFESHVGGGFGIRGEIYPEDVLVCVAAMRLDRPVKWIEDRREHLIAANHSRHQHHQVRAACTEQGEILAIDDVIHHDNGAYVRTHATRVAMMTCGVLPGPYRVPGAYRAVCHFRLTNKTPAATYRAPGRFETTFVRERLIDAIAHQLSLDPIDVRRINAVRVDEMPFKRPLEALGEEIHFDSGDYHKLLDKLLDHVKWTELNAELARRREAGEMVGAGLAMFVEKAGLGPVDGVRIQVDTSGHVNQTCDVIAGRGGGWRLAGEARGCRTLERSECSSRRHSGTWTPSGTTSCVVCFPRSDRKCCAATSTSSMSICDGVSARATMRWPCVGTSLTSADRDFCACWGIGYGSLPPNGDQSITESEIRYAVLDHPRDSENAWFFFRDPAASAAMEERRPGDFREPKDSENSRRLHSLKQSITDAGFVPIVYSPRWDGATRRLVDLAEFGESVAEKIWSSVVREHDIDDPDPSTDVVKTSARRWTLSPTRKGARVLRRVTRGDLPYVA